MSASLRSELDAVRGPVSGARGLPNAQYVSTAAYEEERHSVLFANWVGIGFGKDVPNPGDVRPVEFLGLPLLIVRDRSTGEIGVFENTCRHRGMILVEQPANIRKVIRCPYHSWCYGLDGKLEGTPHVGGPGRNTHAAIRREELGLFRVRAHVWRDVVFVDISGRAPPFEEQAGGLIERWRDFDQPISHGGASSSLRLDVRTNWKLAVENYCESYHLPWIHPGLNSYSRLEDHYNIEDDRRYSGQGTLVYRQLRGDNGTVFPDHENLAPKWEAGAEYVALFPNVLFGVHRDHSYAIVLEPVGVDRTIEHIELYYTDAGASDPSYGAMRDANAKLWHTVFAEDIGVVEGMQRGRHGASFDGGRFSPVMDSATHRFHAWVADAVVAGREARHEPPGGRGEGDVAAPA